MTLVRWKPFGDLVSMHDKINRLFDDAFKDADRQGETRSTWYPLADIHETKDAYVFKFEVPGLTKDDINIQVNENTLSVSGEKKADKKVKDDEMIRVETFAGKFSRSFTLPRNVDAKNIKANLKDGILELTINKSEEGKPKAIPISIG